MVAATGHLENGVITNHLVNWLSPMKERLTIVTGEKGAFVADTITADLTFFENGTVATEWESMAAFRGVSEGNVTRLAIPKPEPLRTEHEAFRDAVLGLRSDVVTMQEGLDTLRVAEAVLESATNRQIVKIAAS
jgi:predicted dehydrogenase